MKLWKICYLGGRGGFVVLHKKENSNVYKSNYRLSGKCSRSSTFTDEKCSDLLVNSLKVWERGQGAF